MIYNKCFNILKSPKDIYINEQDSVSFTYTLGCSRFPLDSTDEDELLNLADKALYRGKMKGRNCYIIYLPEKHKNIGLKSERDKTFSVMYLNSKVFNELTKPSDLATNIKNTIDFLGNYFMIDHIYIEDKNSLLFEYYHPLCKYKSSAILGEELKSALNN